jgi:hypothetical protein
VLFYRDPPRETLWNMCFFTQRPQRSRSERNAFFSLCPSACFFTAIRRVKPFGARVISHRNRKGLAASATLFFSLRPSAYFFAAIRRVKPLTPRETLPETH